MEQTKIELFSQMVIDTLFLSLNEYENLTSDEYKRRYGKYNCLRLKLLYNHLLAELN